MDSRILHISTQKRLFVLDEALDERNETKKVNKLNNFMVYPFGNRHCESSNDGMQIVETNQHFYQQQ